jgi:hypothetical protein
MMVEHDTSVNERVRQLFLFHMAGIAILTLVINGSTTGMLVRYLKLHKGSWYVCERTKKVGGCERFRKLTDRQTGWLAN